MCARQHRWDWQRQRQRYMAMWDFILFFLQFLFEIFFASLAVVVGVVTLLPLCSLHTDTPPNRVYIHTFIQTNEYYYYSSLYTHRMHTFSVSHTIAAQPHTFIRRNQTIQSLARSLTHTHMHTRIVFFSFVSFCSSTSSIFYGRVRTHQNRHM